jgi:hypothetical protein
MQHLAKRTTHQGMARKSYMYFQRSVVVGQLHARVVILAFKWSVFEGAITQKNTPRNSFYIFRQQENIMNFLDTLRNLYFLFHKMLFTFIILSSSVQIKCFL